MVSGRCRCGAIHYVAEGDPVHSTLCHCSDCRRSAGAPMVGWALFSNDQLRITGTPVSFQSSDNVIRQFCGTCGTGLFYRNEAIFPDMVDVQTGTLDHPSALPPQAHIQMAEAPAWMAGAHELPKFNRYPSD